MQTAKVKMLGMSMVAVSLLASLTACGSSQSASASQGNSAAPASTANTSSPGSSAKQVKKIDIALTDKTATNWPIFVADKLGYFKQQGIELNFISVGASSGVAQQLAANAVGIGTGAMISFIEAIQGGAPIKYILNEVTVAPYTLVGKKQYHSIKDLKGKTIIVAGPKTATRVFLDKMMNANGMKTGDYTLTYAGATNARYAALKSGTVDAAMLFPPFDAMALSDGYSNLGRLTKYLPSYPFNGIAVSDKWASQHSEDLVSFLKGYQEGVKWLYDPKNKDQAVQILKEFTGTSTTNGGVAYDVLVTQNHAYSTTGKTDDAGLKSIFDSMAKLGQLKGPIPTDSSKYYDNQYADKAAAGN